MKLWFDDIRRPPDDSWLWARTLPEALEIVRSKAIFECSLDCDLGLHEVDPHTPNADFLKSPDAHLHPNGIDLVEAMVTEKLVPPRVTIHSMSRSGARRMAAVLEKAGHEPIIARFDPACRA